MCSWFLFFSRREDMFKMWKGIEKKFRKMKVKEEEKKRKKAKKDAVDDQGKGNDGDKWKKDDGEDKGKKGDGDKRKRKDDDYIAGEELEEQIRAEADRERRQEQIRVEVDRERRQEVPVDTLEYIEDEDEGDAEVDDNNNKLWRKRLMITTLMRRFMTLLVTMTKREKKGRVLISKRRWGHYANGWSPVMHIALKKNYERID